ncbi:MAG: ABC transporter permease [Ignavibacteriales bacterium]|nr:ABC transporter permease [Ignavibacteriales bacterium]
MTAVTVLVQRELIRFVRQRSRMLAVIVSPVLFWVVIGSGLNRSFQYPGGPQSMTYLEYFYPGTLVLVVLFASIFSSISLIEDRRDGFLQSVLVAPINRSSIVLGKVAGITILAALQGVVFLAAAPAVIQTSSIGSIVLTLFVLVLVATGLSSLGFLIAWSMDSTQGFHAIMNLLLVPMWLLSGALFPITGSASWVAEIMRWNPLMYGVAATRKALYGLAPGAGQELPGFGVSLLILIGFTVVTVLVAAIRVQKRLASKPLEESR